MEKLSEVDDSYVGICKEVHRSVFSMVCTSWKKPLSYQMVGTNQTENRTTNHFR